MRTTMALAVFLLAHAGVAAAGTPDEVPDGQLKQWWIWTNEPAVNYEAQGYFLARKVDGLDVEFAFTISTDGLVTDCTVVRKAEPDQPDDKLCDLISLHEYEPAKSNPERLPVRTRSAMMLGVSNARVQELLRNNPK